VRSSRKRRRRLLAEWQRRRVQTVLKTGQPPRVIDPVAWEALDSWSQPGRLTQQRQRSGWGHVLVERDLENQITGTLKAAVHSERTIRSEVRTFPMCAKRRSTRPAMVR
jgi:hypothetical protein